MSLHVKIGPRWTFGSHCSSGRRGYLIRSSRPPSPFSTSLAAPGLSRLSVTSTVPRRSFCQSLRYTQPSPSLCSSETKQSSPAQPNQTTCSTPCAHGRDISSTNVDVKDSKNGTSIPKPAFRRVSLRTISDDTFDGAAPSTSQGIRKDLDSVSALSSPLIHDALPITSTAPTTNTAADFSWVRAVTRVKAVRRVRAVTRARAVRSGELIVRSVEPNERSKRHAAYILYRILPKKYDEEMTRLASLLSERRTLEDIRDAFRTAISVRDRLMCSHGWRLDRWLAGPWGGHKSDLVMQVLLGSIVTSLPEALRVLQSMEKMDHDFNRRAQYLSYVGHMYKVQLAKSPENMAKFDAEVKKLTSPEVWPTTKMSPRHLGLLLWRANDEEVQGLIEQFRHKYPRMETQKRLLLSRYCTLNNMESLALDILTDLPSNVLAAGNELMLKCCSILLQRDVVESTPNGPNFKFLPRLLEKGLKPDSFLYAGIIERALASGNPGVAWDIFRHLKTKGYKMTGWTYLVLLRNAFEVGNFSGVQELLAEIQLREPLYKNVYLLTYSMNIVRRIFHHEKDMTTAESLSHLLALYDRLFSRDPLIRLGIVPKPVSRGSRARVDGKAKPDAYCLSFMIWAFVLCNRNGGSVRKLWARIQELLEAGDAEIEECMRLDLIYNAFIWLNLRDRQPQSMAIALEIFQYMLNKQLCVPTDRTWSILICGYLRCDQMDQAKHIYGMMKQCELTTKDIRQEYWRKNWTLEYFEEHLEEVLDENMMPDGTELGGIEADEVRGLSEKDMMKKYPGLEPDLWTWEADEDDTELEMDDRSSLTPQFGTA